VLPPLLSVALRPSAGHGLFILEVSRSHTTTHHSRWDSSGRVISSSQRPLPDNTQHSQQTNFRTHDLSRRAAADLRLRPRGHWDRQHVSPVELNSSCAGSCQTKDVVFLFARSGLVRSVQRLSYKQDGPVFESQDVQETFLFSKTSIH
jgi:hypothetical protein